VQSHHRQHEHQHDHDDRAENRMSAATLDHTPEADHERGSLQDFPASGHFRYRHRRVRPWANAVPGAGQAAAPAVSRTRYEAEPVVLVALTSKMPVRARQLTVRPAWDATGVRLAPETR
jgi:hypothetical protein